MGAELALDGEVNEDAVDFGRVRKTLEKSELVFSKRTSGLELLFVDHRGCPACVPDVGIQSILVGGVCRHRGPAPWLAQVSDHETGLFCAGKLSADGFEKRHESGMTVVALALRAHELEAFSFSLERHATPQASGRGSTQALCRALGRSGDL